MTTTPNIPIKIIEASQNQKEVTINDGSYLIDALASGRVLDKDLTTPPVSPTNGDTYIVAATATGDWVGKENQIAYYSNGWKFIPPIQGWTAFVVDEFQNYFYTGSKWVSSSLYLTPDYDYVKMARTKVVSSSLSGANVTETGVIKDRQMVLACCLRVTEAITGATSFDAGYTGNTGAFGGSIGISLDTTNEGLLGNPQSFFADTDLIYTANGANFTGGEITAIIQYIDFRGDWNW